ncbi:MAG: alpha/beta hydrolase, partial [Alphaproteobacteria bacterium]
IAQLTKDGNELAAYLCNRLHKDKIILLGHSWGSILGVHMVRDRPDLFYAYVGTGQLVSEQKDAIAGYPLLVARARAQGNKQAEKELLAAGPPPYPDDIRAWLPLELWAQALDPAPPQQPPPSPGQLWLMMRDFFKPDGLSSMITPAVQFSMISLWPEIVKDDLPSLGLKFDVPVVFIQGAEDITTSTAVAKDYFDQIEAPSKQFITLPHVGHLAVFRDRGRFLRALEEDVHPLALANGG